jgi:hypothetical protein
MTEAGECCIELCAVSPHPPRSRTLLYTPHPPSPSTHSTLKPAIEPETRNLTARKYSGTTQAMFQHGQIQNALRIRASKSRQLQWCPTVASAFVRQCWRGESLIGRRWGWAWRCSDSLGFLNLALSLIPKLHRKWGLSHSSYLSYFCIL